MKIKKILIVWLLSLLILFVFKRIYINNSFLLNLNHNRSDVLLHMEEETPSILEIDKISKGIFCLDEKGKGNFFVSYKIPYKYIPLSFQITMHGTGKLLINLNSKNITTEYKNFMVNNKKIFDYKHLSSDSDINYSQTYTDGEKISIRFEVRRYVSLKELLKSVNFYIFFSLAILVFGIVSKVMMYLSAIKQQEQIPTADIILVIIFIISLFIPISHVSQHIKSDTERRLLAQPAKLFSDNNSINNKFGKDFEAWFNDHFYGRFYMMSLYNTFINKIRNKGNQYVMIGQEGWLYQNHIRNIKMFKNENLFSKKELEKIGENIAAFVAKAQKTKKKVYFYLSNDKESLYSEFYPAYIKKTQEESRLMQVVGYIHNKYPEIKFFNFYDKFKNLKKKNKSLFCKTGTHMNDLGAFYEYYYLIGEIKKDYPQIKLLELKNFDIKEDFQCDEDLLNMLKDKKYSKKNLKAPQLTLLSSHYKTVYNNKRYIPDTGSDVEYKNTKAGNRLKVLFISDSFGRRYSKYMAENFYIVYNIFIGHGLDFALFENELQKIKEMNPNIIIIETTERYLNRFLKLKYPEL